MSLETETGLWFRAHETVDGSGRLALQGIVRAIEVLHKERRMVFRHEELLSLTQQQGWQVATCFSERFKLTVSGTEDIESTVDVNEIVTRDHRIASYIHPLSHFFQQTKKVNGPATEPKAYEECLVQLLGDFSNCIATRVGVTQETLVI